MRMLPDNPSVDFLKKEAKDLLAGLREATPAASLADAQRTLAEQYGFRTWTELKAGVDLQRNAVPAADPSLANELAEAFALGKVTGPMRPIGYEYMGRKWSLETEKGRWIASPLFAWIGEQAAEIAATVREAARGVGVKSPVAVRSASGKLVERVQDTTWRIDEWMDFGPTPTAPVRASVAASAGEVLGAIHSLALPTDGTIHPHLTSRKPQSEWDDLLRRARDARKPFADELERAMPAIGTLRAITAPIPDTLILSNCDLVLEGVRMGKGNELVVVHWDFASPHDPAFELAYVLNQWTMWPTLNEPAARALAAAYGERLGSVPTLTLPSFSIAISGYLNWFYNQFCEAIDPESPERLDFAEREAQVLLRDPLTLAKLERLIESLTPALQ